MNGPNDARRIIWARFLPLKPLPVSYDSSPIVAIRCGRWCCCCCCCHYRYCGGGCYALVTSSRAPTLAPHASLFTPFSIFKPRLIFIADLPLFLTHCDSIPVMTPLYF